MTTEEKKSERLDAQGFYLPKRMRLPDYDEDTMPSDHAAVADLLSAILESILHPKGNPATLLARIAWMESKMREKAAADVVRSERWRETVSNTLAALREEAAKNEHGD